MKPGDSDHPRSLVGIVSSSEYESAYQTFIAAMEKIIPEITALGSGLDSVFLTDHGQKHIEQLILRAQELCSQGKIKLTEYEAYILLVAVHLHDIGNALGRRGHTHKIEDVFALLYGPLGFGYFDRLLAEQIASVHGGEIDGSEDTLATLPADHTVFEKPVRPQLLAAIVRLSDELSEAPYRANQLGIASGELPSGSDAYHYYAFGLHTTQIDATSRSVRLKFWFRESWFTKQISKDDIRVNFLDYIFNRTIKTYDEAIYCTKYMMGSLFFDKVHVDIDIFNEKTRRTMKRIGYTLRQHGFPSRQSTRDSIYELAPELNNFNGLGKLTAESLARGLDGSISKEGMK